MHLLHRFGQALPRRGREVATGRAVSAAPQESHEFRFQARDIRAGLCAHHDYRTLSVIGAEIAHSVGESEKS
ncbi:hypothetical protein [Nocardia cyriacigeorgica]|uniref:hypothetical protein n=1 Tax=Nocardia cyriacigeorgica TaxID=135487 RepID=UPI001E4D224E|nr:hypothetical protein [Nocardia cyriacigeorgica]